MSACWWRVGAVRPSAGARRRGSLSPDCPPARPCLIDDGHDGGEEAAEGGAEEESLGRLELHSIEFGAGAGGGDGQSSDAFSTIPAHLHGEALITARPS